MPCFHTVSLMVSEISDSNLQIFLHDDMVGLSCTCALKK